MQQANKGKQTASWPPPEAMQVEPIAGKTAGATVRGVNLVTMDASEWEQILDAFHQHGFLVIKDSALSSAEQAAFGAGILIQGGRGGARPPWPRDSIGFQPTFH